MTDLLTSIYNKIDTLTTATVVKDTAPNATSFPYVVYNLNIPSVSYERNECELIINIWTNSSTEIETISEALWEGLDKYSVGDGTIAYSIRTLLMTSVPDPDEEVYRKQLTFQVLYYKEA